MMRADVRALVAGLLLAIPFVVSWILVRRVGHPGIDACQQVAEKRSFSAKPAT